jgi:hypothetical protein
MKVSEFLGFPKYHLILTKGNKTEEIITSSLEEVFTKTIKLFVGNYPIDFELPSYEEKYNTYQLWEKPYGYKIKIRIKNNFELPTYKDVRVVLIAKNIDEEKAKQIGEKLEKTVRNLNRIVKLLRKTEEDLIYKWENAIRDLQELTKENPKVENALFLESILKKKKFGLKCVYKDEYYELKLDENALLVSEALKREGIENYSPYDYEQGTFEKLGNFLKNLDKVFSKGGIAIILKI